MYERWNEFYQLMETWLSLFTALFTGFSVYVVWKGYKLAKEYKEQHEVKLKVERNHRFAEKMIQLLHEIDTLMSELFNDKVLYSPEWQKEVKRVDELTDGFILIGYPKIRYFYRRHLAVKANRDTVWAKIMALNQELIMYIGYFEDERMTNYRGRMIFAAKDLIEWIVVTFPKLMKEDQGPTDKYLENFESNIAPKFPDTMYVQVPMVEKYCSYRDRLTELVFGILK